MGEKLDLQQTACMDYQTLQSRIYQETQIEINPTVGVDPSNVYTAEIEKHILGHLGLQVVEDDLMSKFNNLRKKIINTDIVIQKYNALEKKFEVNRKHLEKANLLITKLQKDLNYSDGQLREALLITDPLKKQNTEIVSQNFVLSNKVTNLEEKLIADEKTKQQLEAALKKFKEDAENVELLEATLIKEKKTLEKLAKSKEDAISLKDSLKETRFQYQKLQQKNKTIVKYLVLFGKLLHDRNLLNKAQKRVLIKYSSQDDSKEHSDSDTPTSDLDEEGLLIESQLLNSSNSAHDVSIQTENFYKTQCSQTEGYSEITDAILNDIIQQFISIPKALSPLPPSPKRHNKRKSSLDSSNERLPQKPSKEMIVPLECCGCCKKVVRQKEEIDILKSKSCEISRKSQGNSQNAHNNYKENSGSFKTSPVNLDNGVWETVEENLIDNDHSYCSAKVDQNTILTTAARNEEAIECINTDNHKSEYPPQEPSKRLVKPTLNDRFTVPFFKKGSIFRSVDEDNSCPLLETRYKVKFFKKSNLYSEEDERKKNINFSPNLNTLALNNKKVSYSYLNENICKSTATEENICTQKRTVTRDLYFQNTSEMPENIFEAETLFFDEIDQNILVNPLKSTPLVKRPYSRSTTNTILKRPRVQLGINPLKAIEKCRQSLKKSMQIGKHNRNSAIVAQAKPPNAKNVLNVESGTSAEDYTSPVPKKARLSRCSTESALSTSLERNGGGNLNDSYDKLMTELFGDEDQEMPCTKESVTNVIENVIHEICESPRVANFVQTTGKEESDIPAIAIEIKSNDLQNNTSVVESVKISEVDEPVVSLNEEQINNSTDKLISNAEKINISLVATPTATFRENSTEIIYKLTWNSLLSKNVFAKRQHIQKNEMKSGADVIKSVIQVMASLSVDLVSVEHIWKGVVHRLEEAFSNHSLDINLLVIELSNWVQTNPIETLDFRTGLPIASTNLSSILTEEEIKCSIFTKYLKMSSFGERYLNSLCVNFVDAMMNQSNMAKKCALCRFLMYLYKESQNMEAARILCYDVIYHFTSSPGTLLMYMFSIWPEAFVGNSAKRSCIMKTICLLLRKEHAELGISTGFLNKFQRFFHSDSTTDDIDNSVILLLHQLGHDKHLYFEAAKSIELIAKVKHWNWTKLLIQRLLQILSRNGWKLLEKKDLMPEHLVKANLLYLLGCLGKQSPLEDTETNRNILKIAKLFISTPKEPFCIKETAALVSVMLIKFDQGAAIFMVQKWLPYNARRISESLKMLLIKHNLWSS